ncbi:MAG: protein kinase [Phycisphaera sp. RhM]|nr:protein kinase [Phycisphaera sp. RhM]
MSEVDQRDELIGRIADEFLRDCRAGCAPSIETLVSKHPEFADELRDLLPTLAVMEQVKLSDEEEDSDHLPAADESMVDRTLGDYQIIRQIGRGGMGIVYEAEQISLGRRVAIKVMPRQSSWSGTQRTRFEREAKAAARLHHTNIVPVFGVGQAEGVHYYVMQLIVGQGLDDVLDQLKSIGRRSADEIGHRSIWEHVGGGEESEQTDQKPSSPSSGAAVARSGSQGGIGSSTGSSIDPYWRNVARIGLQVSDALQYAHTQGVTHRDIKPSNLLLDHRNDVWITDFGLAKADDDDGKLTRSGDILGTIRYMPPEAFSGRSDGRSDVYSLGITLYEMATLVPAFDAVDRRELVKQVTTGRPLPVSRVNRQVPRDLATIIEKAMECRPEDRYASAGKMREDLRRFLNDEPILARRATLGERCGRWARQNRGLAASLAAVASLLLLIALASSGAAIYYFDQEEQQRRLFQQARSVSNANEQLLHELEGALDQSRQATIDAENARQTAERESERTSRSLYSASMINAANSMDQHRGFARAQELLDQWRPTDHRPDRRGWEWFYIQAFCNQHDFILDGHDSEVHALALGPQQRLASAGRDAQLLIWDLQSRQVLRQIDSPVGPLNCVSWDGPRNRIAVGGSTGIAVYETKTWKRIYLSPSPLTIYALRWSPDGRWLARIGRAPASAGPVRHYCLLDADTLDVAQELPGVLNRSVQFTFQIDWSEDSRLLAYPAKKQARVWDRDAEQLRFETNKSWGELRAIQFHPTNPNEIIVCGRDGVVRLWDWNRQQIVTTMTAHTHAAATAAWHPSGQRVATASWDGTVRIWQSETGTLLRTLHGHERHVFNLQWDSIGEHLFSTGMDGAIKCWRPEAAVCRRELPATTHPVSYCGLSPDSERVALASGVGELILRDTNDGHVLAEAKHGRCRLKAIDFAPDGRRLAIVGGVGTVYDPGLLRVWDSKFEWPTREVRPDATLRAVDWSPDGKWIAVGGDDGSVSIFDPNLQPCTRTIKREPGSIWSLAWRPDAKELAIGGIRSGLRVWDFETQQTRRWHQPQDSVIDVAWSRSGKQLAVSTTDNLIKILDAADLRQIAQLPKQFETVYALKWGPGDRRLMTIDARGTLLLWDPVSLQRTLKLTVGSGEVRAADWSEDGAKIIAPRANKIVLWDASRGYAAESKGERPATK